MESRWGFEFKWWRTDFFFNHSRSQLHYFLSCWSFIHFWRRTIKNWILVHCLKHSLPLIWLESKCIYSFFSILNMYLLSSWWIFDIIKIRNIWIFWKFTLIMVSSGWPLLCLKSAWLNCWIVYIILIKGLWVIIMISIG